MMTQCECTVANVATHLLLNTTCGTESTYVVHVAIDTHQ
jgi:hypothetical protein